MENVDEEVRKAFAIPLIKDGLSDAEINKFTGCSIEEIKNLREECKWKLWNCYRGNPFCVGFITEGSSLNRELPSVIFFKTFNNK